MMLPDTPNATTPVSLRKNDFGWPVFALQRALISDGFSLTADGSFGALTEGAVVLFQKRNNLMVDGIAGPSTQLRMIAKIDAETSAVYKDMPTGLLRGFAESEGGNNLGAVNWRIKGGVDCGVVQIRCSGPPFDQQTMRIAYDPVSSMNAAASLYEDRERVIFALTFAKKQPRSFSQRLAALAWNWPWAAEQYGLNGRLPNPNLDATWALVNGVRVKFPDGQPVMTYQDWAEFYALGGRHGEGRVTRYVKW